MYLIDGHNLIPKIYGMSLAMDDKENQLIELLQEFARLKRKKVEVYFDNAPPGYANTRKFGSITAHFIRQGLTADNAIIDRVRKMGKQASQVIVVSSDHAIQNEVRACSATAKSSEEFFREMQAMHNQPGQSVKPDPERQSAAEIAEFERLFLQKKKSSKK
ncbi:MAG: hypothetical protein BGO78_07110 [Chloroflexi bacterium 44-23]|nr:MAG: hypothetical protein BGO78_07110 [Chloroflexi bacterium 44-23]